jgi:hypothetical protein
MGEARGGGQVPFGTSSKVPCALLPCLRRTPAPPGPLGRRAPHGGPGGAGLPSGTGPVAEGPSSRQAACRRCLQEKAGEKGYRACTHDAGKVDMDAWGTCCFIASAARRQ